MMQNGTMVAEKISTPALREEGDMKPYFNFTRLIKFQPPPSARRATTFSTDEWR